ncbi:MAG: translation initiation factor 2 [Sphaerochaetaceae bacterium]
MSILPYLLQKENIAHVQDGILYIGDRRTFPFQRTFFPCHDAGEIAFALRSMVTQGGGPLQVALTALPFLARKAGSFSELQGMMDLIKASRKTNTTMARTIDGILEKVKDGRDMEERLSLLVEEQEAKFQSEYEVMGKAGALLLPQEARVLTTCFAEHSFLLCLQYAREIGKKVVVMVNETRPYLQGSRLTAPSLKELGFEVSLVTDGMGAHYMAENEINVYMTACDVLCKDGTVVNKVGTLNL